MSTIRQCIAALTLCVAPLVVSVVPGSAARAASAPSTGSIVARLDGLFRGLTKNEVFSGTVLVAQNGKVLLSKGYGMADMAHRAPNTAGTEFPATGTLTGQFTAAAILRLQEQGKLRVQDHICSYIAACPPAWRSITIQELLNGSSGIHDYFNDPANAAAILHPITLARLMTLIGSYALDATPGAQCGAFYNGSYPVLGYIVAQVSGESYATYVRRQFLGPLGLRHTGIAPTHPRAPRHAVGYDLWDVPTIISVDSSSIYASGDLYSTVGDLYRWNKALLGGQVLSHASLQAMFTPTCTYCPPNCNQDQRAGGMGDDWDIGVLQGRRYRSLGGGLPGFTVGEISYPKQHTTFIVLSNQADSQLDVINSEMEQRVFG